MFSLKCPLCGSKRIKRGYRQIPIIWKLLGKHYLLCSRCNWEFEATLFLTGLPSRRQRQLYKEEEKLEMWEAKRTNLNADADSDIDKIIQARNSAKTENFEENEESPTADEVITQHWFKDADLFETVEGEGDYLENDSGQDDDDDDDDRTSFKVKKRIRLKLQK